MLTIDGSHGEGGGQILRTALSLSAILDRPFRMINIRANRKKPGLMPQHLAAVRAAREVSNAAVTGDNTGSRELTFVPNAISGGSFRFDIGTAGSTSLVLQTVIPILHFAARDSSVTVTGGTNLPFSPSADYLAEVFAPMLQKVGCHIRLHRDRYGFYPRGGGIVRAEIIHMAKLSPLTAVSKGNLRRISGCSAVGNLPESIGERQKRRALELLRSLPCPQEIRTAHIDVYGPGTFLFLLVETENARAGFEALGAPGKPAETVAAEAAGQLLDYIATDAAIDPHLADQLVLYLGLCRERSLFTTSAVTGHLLTNLWILQQFDACKFSIEGLLGFPGTIRIN